MVGKDQILLLSPKKSSLFLSHAQVVLQKKINENSGLRSVITDHIRACTNVALSVFCYLPALLRSY